MRYRILVAVWLLGFAIAHSQDTWSIYETDSTAIASTTNADDNIFGVLCKRSVCYYMVTLKNKCDEGNSYPVLANSDAGTHSYTISCVQEITGAYAYSFTNYDAIDSLSRLANDVSFAVPIEDSKFRVERFSLKGNIAIIDQMMKKVVAKYKSTTKGYEM